MVQNRRSLRHSSRRRQLRHRTNRNRNNVSDQVHAIVLMYNYAGARELFKVTTVNFHKRYKFSNHVCNWLKKKLCFRRNHVSTKPSALEPQVSSAAQNHQRYFKETWLHDKPQQLGHRATYKYSYFLTYLLPVSPRPEMISPAISGRLQFEFKVWCQEVMRAIAQQPFSRSVILIILLESTIQVGL